jgi:hypothetical protein
MDLVSLSNENNISLRSWHKEHGKPKPIKKKELTS